MPTAVASGSGEPPERSDYGGEERHCRVAAYLNHALQRTAQQRRFAPLLPAR